MGFFIGKLVSANVFLLILLSLMNSASMFSLSELFAMFKGSNSSNQADSIDRKVGHVLNGYLARSVNIRGGNTKSQNDFVPLDNYREINIYTLEDVNKFLMEHKSKIQKRDTITDEIVGGLKQIQDMDLALMDKKGIFASCKWAVPLPASYPLSIDHCTQAELKFLLGD